jgi:succinate dehydrogenase/fumarate reductase flavoprotein subunit
VGHAVVLATGGFGASKDLLKEHNPMAAPYATTNGPWATGDGLRLAQDFRAGVKLMDQVQLHPTGLVDPANPDAGTKVRAHALFHGSTRPTHQ